MFLCRVRLSAAALDQAFKPAAAFLVQLTANRQGDGTLHKGHALQGHRCFSVTVRGVGTTRVRPGKPQPEPQAGQNWDSSSGAVITDWAHLDRVAAVAANLSQSVQSEAGHSDVIRQPLVRASGRYSSRGEPVCNVLFTGSWGVSGRLCATRTMQTRASSTKSSDAGEGQPAAGNKGEEQNLKEASTTSSSTAKAPGEPEPDGGKPNKTQQLKKVFKEYGAVGVSFHVCISLMSLGMFYLLISSGIDMGAMLCKLGFSETVVQSKMAAGTSTFVVAYAIHKLFAPVRISITLVSVPLIVRYFRKTGLFKPPTPAP